MREPRRPQFRLRTLLGLTTGMCILFSLVASIGIGPLHALFGFWTAGVSAALGTNAQLAQRLQLLSGWKKSE